MKLFKKLGPGRSVLVILCVAMLLASVVCLVQERLLATELESQKAAERWRGESETAYSQVSCFIPTGSPAGVEDIYGVRTALLEKLAAASVDTTDWAPLFTDCWSTPGSMSVEGDNGKGTASIIAAGGNYFLFHPLRLLSGNYFTPTDLNSDRVLLDEELAWLLFGSSDVQGLEIKIGEKIFIVCGVVERESDRASREAYSSGMGLYMSYDAYASFFEQEPGITTYELVAAEPVTGFVLNTVKEAFPVKESVILCNTGRFRTSAIFELIKNYGMRSMQVSGTVLPYWENAARYTEDRCALLLTASAVLALLPLVLLLFLTVKAIAAGKKKLQEDLIPEMQEKVAKRVDEAEWKRWEKLHPGEKRPEAQPEKAPEE